MNRKDILGGLVVTIGILCFVCFSYLGTFSSNGTAQELITPGAGITLPEGRDRINRNFTKIFEEVATGTSASVVQLGTGAPLVNKSGRDWSSLTLSTIGNNITISTAGGTIRINASASGIGDITGGVSLGTGAAVFESEDTGTLKFRSFKAGPQMDVTEGSTEITINPDLQFATSGSLIVGGIDTGGTGQFFGKSDGKWFINFGVDSGVSDMTGATGALNVNGGVHTTNGSVSVVSFGPRNANSNTGIYFSSTPGEILFSSAGSKAIVINNVSGNGTLNLFNTSGVGQALSASSTGFSWGSSAGLNYGTLSSNALSIANNSDFTVSGTGGVTSVSSTFRIKKPLKLQDYTTAALPAPNTGIGILVNNTTTNTIYYSDGVTWYSLPKLLGSGALYANMEIVLNRLQHITTSYAPVGGGAVVPLPFAWTSGLTGGGAIVSTAGNAVNVPIDGTYRIHYYVTMASTVAGRFDIGVSINGAAPISSGKSSQWVPQDTAGYADGAEIGVQTISGETIQALTSSSAVGISMAAGTSTSVIKIKYAGFNVLFIGD